MIYALLGFIALSIFFLILRIKRNEPNVKYDFVEAKLTDNEIEFMDLMNAYRKIKQVHELICDETARFTAFKHNFEMMHTTVSHDGYGERVKELMEAGAYEVGEITGGYYTSVTGAFKEFLESPKHEAKIKSIRYNVCGLDISKNDKGKLFITCLFLKI